MQRLAGGDRLNMTRLALNLSDYVNGVARRHAETTEHMFPGYRIHAITNGVHLGTWTHPAFAALYTANFPRWQHEPEILVRVLQLPDDVVWECHSTAKDDLIQLVKSTTGRTLDPAVFTLGFARRMTGYKRPLLLFEELDRLTAIADRRPMQIVVAGKAHPRDAAGKEAIRRIQEIAGGAGGKLTCVFVPGYDMRLAMTLAAGADVWLNTPLPPMEASGTSGMKATLNGVLNLSVLDGWWIEACVEGVTGWSIGDDPAAAADENQAAVRLTTSWSARSCRFTTEISAEVCAKNMHLGQSADDWQQQNGRHCNDQKTHARANIPIRGHISPTASDAHECAVSPSISTSSSDVSTQSAAFAFWSSCSGLVAPAITLATVGRASNQLNASSRRLCFLSAQNC